MIFFYTVLAHLLMFLNQIQLKFYHFVVLQHKLLLHLFHFRLIMLLLLYLRPQHFLPHHYLIQLLVNNQNYLLFFRASCDVDIIFPVFNPKFSSFSSVRLLKSFVDNTSSNPSTLYDTTPETGAVIYSESDIN